MIGTTTELAALQRVARAATSSSPAALEQLRDLGYVADQAYVAFTYADSHVATARAELVDGGALDVVGRRLDDAAGGYDRAVAAAEQAFGAGTWTGQVAADRAAVVRQAIARLGATDDVLDATRGALTMLDAGAADSELARRALGRMDLASAIARVS